MQGPKGIPCLGFPDILDLDHFAWLSAVRGSFFPYVLEAVSHQVATAWIIGRTITVVNELPFSAATGEVFGTSFVFVVLYILPSWLWINPKRLNRHIA